jgi:hypothetical protein
MKLFGSYIAFFKRALIVLGFPSSPTDFRNYLLSDESTAIE